MQKQMSSKKTVMIACAAAAVVVVAAVIFLLSRKEEAFRSIMVYELEGSAVIERADIGSIDAAENLYLESGDRVCVQQDSMMRMKLDDDKYITAEADTIFTLEAEGDGQDSKTRICLEQGAVTNEIQKPLSGESMYETSTPNSVMAVRGTIYRAQLVDDGTGGQDMRLCCFDGTVATKPVLPDGTFGEEVLVHAGSELTIYSDGTVDGPTDIDYTSLPEQAWRILEDMLENGADITGITEETLAQIRQDAAQADPLFDEVVSDVPAETEEQKTQDQDAEEQEAGEPQEEVTEAKDKLADSTRKPAKPQTQQNKGQSDKKPEAEATREPSKPKDTPPAQGGTSDNSGSGNSDGGSGQQPDNGNSDGSGEQPDDNRGDTPPKPPKPPKPEEEVNYTVTYQYQGSVFATQTVKSGNKTTAPVLSPAAEGAWDFDFNTKIKADTTIEWKSGN